MRVIIVGMGNQGRKRLAVAEKDVVATVDPAGRPNLDCPLIPHFRYLGDVPDFYDAVLVCTPDAPKLLILNLLLASGKHVMVEKPLLGSVEQLNGLEALARENNAVCYTAYNHRFEPHVARMKNLVQSSRDLGKQYLCKMSYGFGTAADVKGTWRDQGMGVLSEVGSHLVDLAIHWFGKESFVGASVALQSAFEVTTSDHITLAFSGWPALYLEASWISWKNTFTVDLYGEKGSAHIDGLLKWGSSRFTLRIRTLPSGKPSERTTLLERPDETWQREYDHFKWLCSAVEKTNTFDRDMIVSKILHQIYEAGHGNQPARPLPESEA